MGTRVVLVTMIMAIAASAPSAAGAAMQEAKLLASDGAFADRFGGAVAVSGDTAVIGAYDADNRGFDSGAAYVFTRSGGAWAEQAELLPSDGAHADFFGSSVAVSGDTAVVGARQGTDVGKGGAAYVFTRSGTEWTLQAKLVARDAAVGDFFGESVALAGETAVIGAHGNDDKGEASGSAYVFTRSGATWTQQAKLLPSDGAAFDVFGTSVAVSEDTALISGRQNNDRGSMSGSAYVFTRSGTTWTQQAKLLPSDGASDDFFGESVAVSGDTAIIGAPGNDDKGESSGSAYVFTRSGGVWSEAAKLIASDGSDSAYFGTSAAISDGTAAIGAYGDFGAGSAYVFTRSGTAWNQRSKLVAPDPAAYDEFGRSVAVSGDVVVIGNPTDDDTAMDSGSAYVFTGASNRARVAINDVALTEGDDGTTHASFEVSLSFPTAGPVIVHFATADASALHPKDYAATSGRLIFEPGELQKTVDVPVYGETLDEPDETFTVDLFGTEGADLGDGQGIATIVDDDRSGVEGATHDVGVAGGGFRTKGHVDAARNGLGPYPVVIKVKNFGRTAGTTEDIFYAVTASEPVTLSSRCAGVLYDVPAGTSASVEGCTVTYSDASDPDPTLTLTVTHNHGDDGSDADASNDADSQRIVIG